MFQHWGHAFVDITTLQIPPGYQSLEVSSPKISHRRWIAPRDSYVQSPIENYTTKRNNHNPPEGRGTITRRIGAMYMGFYF